MAFYLLNSCNDDAYCESVENLYGVSCKFKSADKGIIVIIFVEKQKYIILMIDSRREIPKCGDIEMSK
jgi:hypothetical protein